MLTHIRYTEPSLILLHDHFDLIDLVPPANESEAFKSLCIVATQPDRFNISLSTFFLRVSPLSLQILNLAIANIHNGSSGEGAETDVASTALQHVLVKPAYTDAVAYLPAKWLFTTETSEAHGAWDQTLFFQSHGNGTHVRNLLAMERVLDIVEKKRNGKEESISEQWRDEMAACWHGFARERDRE